jgi:hypothetical protein
MIERRDTSDTGCFRRALEEYYRENPDCRMFNEMETRIQIQIIRRAQRIKMYADSEVK